MLRSCLAILGSLMFFVSMSTHALLLRATLTNSQENPPTVPTTATGAPRPASFGTAVFELNDTMTAMTFTATIFNIDFTGSQTADMNDNLMNAHIHAGPGVTPTANGPVVWGFLGAPFNDINPNDQIVTPFLTGVGGTVSGKWDLLEGNSTAANPNVTLATQLPFILNGQAYINFHTVQFGGGEIRGNIVRDVPEPSVLMLLALGAFGVVVRSGSRTRASVV